MSVREAHIKGVLAGSPLSCRTQAMLAGEVPHLQFPGMSIIRSSDFNICNSCSTCKSSQNLATGEEERGQRAGFRHIGRPEPNAQGT
jgi:hypothetical protein